MPSTFFGLDIGATGLNIYQTALNVTSHNVANAQTEGYTKQILNRHANDPISLRLSYGMAGTGVAADKITQVRDEYYDNKYRTNNSIEGRLSMRAYYLDQVENYFNESNDTGSMRERLESFWNALDEVQKNPTSLAARQQLSQTALSMTDYFNNLAGNLEALQDDINVAIKSKIDRINSYGDQIATLNKQINVIEVNGGFANDLRDQRNLIIDKLSKICNVKVEEVRLTDTDNDLPANFNNAKALTVKINGRNLVDVYSSNKIIAKPRKLNANNTDIDGLYDFEWQDGQSFDLHEKNLGGELQGMIEMRDGNNEDNFNGTVKANAITLKTDTEPAKVVVTDTNINSVEFMNMPPHGILNIGGRKLEYNEIKVTSSKDAATGKDVFTYTFSLADDVSDDAVQAAKDSCDARDGVAKIGRALNYKGIPYYMDRINQFVRVFAKHVNEQHKMGDDLNGKEGIDFFNGIDKVTGYNYTFTGPGTKYDYGTKDVLAVSGIADPFKNDEILISSKALANDTAVDSVNKTVYKSYYMLTAKNFSVTKEVADHPDRIAAGKKGSVGQGNVEDTENIKAMHSLRALSDMFDEGKPDEFAQTLVSDIGVDTKASNAVAKNQEKIVENIDNQRISISGVDQDEETVDLVKFKQAYNLSAHVVQVMNQIYNTLINQMI